MWGICSHICKFLPVCACVRACVCDFKGTDGEVAGECESTCVCAVIGVIGALAGVERQDVVATEGKRRLVIGRC